MLHRFGNSEICRKQFAHAQSAGSRLSTRETGYEANTYTKEICHTIIGMYFTLAIHMEHSFWYVMHTFVFAAHFIILEANYGIFFICAGTLHLVFIGS